MTKNYIVSGHGGCFKGEQYWVPHGVEVHFYCPKDRVLHNDKGYTVLDKLLLGVDVYFAWKATATTPIPAYSCWAYPGIAPASGVFRRKSSTMVMSFAGTSGTKPVALGHIIHQLSKDRVDKMTIIHWLACTTESTGSSANVEYQTPDRL
jgi:hypothetical protein